MKPLKKIQLEIYPDKEQQFYLSLTKYKLSEKYDEEALKAMADAIHFDKELFTSSLKLSEQQEKNVSDKLFQIHTYLLNSKKDSEDYFTVSKENFEKFKASGFGKALSNIFFMLEINKDLKGKEESAEVKARTAAFTLLLGGLMQGIKDSVESSMNSAFKTGIAIQKAAEHPPNVSVGKKGNLMLEFENGKTSAEIFIEKDNQIRKKEISSLKEEFDCGASSIFMLSDGVLLRIKELADDIEISRYENFIVNNGKIDLSKAEIIETTTTSKNPESSSITVETTTHIVLSYEKLLAEQKQREKNENGKSSVQSSESVFSMLNENFSLLLKLPKDNPERIKVRNRMVISLYELLKEHYPEFHSKHASAIITGYIASCMELLDTEEQYDASDRTQNHRKYLLDTVRNILGSRHSS